jgi:endogenous inhibitor of DNA gyrase (YacG/DUF329 family)
MYVCSICGKVDNWGKEWRWKLKLHGKMYSYEGWEETIIFCSKKCQIEYEQDNP